jgi:hypothetical protein
MLLASLACPDVTSTVVADPLVDAGRRIYEQGVLPDGSPLHAIRPEGFVLEGEYAACVTCHRRSGIGDIEGSIDKTLLVPPVAGPILFAPARFHDVYLDDNHYWVPTPAWKRALTRPAYNTETLARALRDGIDSGGTPLVAPMPHYVLDDTAVGALAAYLHQLSSTAAPGTDGATLQLATVVTPDVPPAEVEAIKGVLGTWAGRSRASGKPWQLHVWNLSGPASGWTEQLQRHYAEQPVFAVLSGAGSAEWAPVHRFCEHNRIPCLLPSLDAMPERNESDYYALYFSPGVTLEARILARYLQQTFSEVDKAPRIVQLYDDPAGLSAAETLVANLDKKFPKPVLRDLKTLAPAKALDGLAADDILVLWLRPQQLTMLTTITPQAPDIQHLFLSALLAPPDNGSLPPSWKAQVTYVSLFDDLSVQAELAKLRLMRWLELAGLQQSQDMRRQADAYAAGYLLHRALSEITRQEERRPPVPLSREHLLETLEILANKYSDGTRLVDQDSHVAFYGRMSLGPRQRVAVRGGSLLRYSSPESNRLLAVSKHIVP